MKNMLVGAALALSFAAAPAVAEVNEDGLHTQEWFKESFLELRDDLEEAAEEGKRLVVFVEQKGCIYCKKVHEEVLTDLEVSSYIQENFDVVQLNLYGERMVVDFDGEEMAEKDLATRWGVLFTPTVVFFPEEYDEEAGGSGKDIAVAMMPGAFGRITYRSIFEWIASNDYKEEPNFQRYLTERMAQQ